jgi:3-oxoacyl-(acyl-carrier-protein) synthase
LKEGPAVETATVITGLGAVSPFGWGVGPLWDGLLAGRCALGPIHRFDASPFRSAGGGEVPEQDDKSFPEGHLRAEGYLDAAIGEALADAGLAGPATAIVVGTNFGGMAAAERALAGGEASALWQYEFRSQADRCADTHHIDGVRLVLSQSCASGAAAIAIARDLVLAGRARRVVAAGYDELSRYVFAGLAALRAMSPKGLRPFDIERDGTLFSEGAGALVIEYEDSARERGATVHARLAGTALTNDAYHMTAPEKEARGISALMSAALNDAGLSPDAVDHINLHGTGTKYNDLIETRAVRNVFAHSAASIPVTANKSAFGHALGAAGVLESVAACMSMRNGVVPPTIGLENQDPECDLDVVTGGPRECRLDTILKTSYGIGGTNAAVVLARSSGGGPNA